MFLLGYIVGLIAGVALVGICLVLFGKTDCDDCILVRQADEVRGFKGVA